MYAGRGENAVYRTSRHKNGKHWMHIVPAMVFCLLLCALLGACGSEEPDLPFEKDLSDITIQEYMGDDPVSMEVAMHYTYNPPLGRQDETLFYVSGHSDWKRITNEKKIPVREKSLLFRFIDRNGEITEAFLFEDEKYSYLELAGRNVWRERKNQNNRLMSFYAERYKSLEFQQCYEQPLLDNQLSLLDTYNGAGKAIWVDVSGEAIVDGQWGRCIPAGWRAEHAEDVRFVIAARLRSKQYLGYWYNPGTGERLDDAYDKKFTVVAYDLLKGDEVIIEDGITVFHMDNIEEYLTSRAGEGGE